jgi:outer membrane protein TolC
MLKKSNMPLAFLFLFNLFLSNVVFSAQPAHKYPIKYSISYSEVMQKMIEGYPSIEAFNKKTEAVRNHAKASWWSYGPNFVVSTSHSFYSGTIASLPGVDFSSQDTIFYGLSFTLFDGGATAFTSKALDTQTEIAELNARLNVESLALQASQAYAGLLIAKSYVIFLEKITSKLKEYTQSKDFQSHYGHEFVDQLENTTSLYLSKISPAKLNFKIQENLLKLVAVGASDKELENLEPLESIITKIEIPKDLETAIQQIPQTLGYQIAVGNVEVAKNNKYSNYARKTSPVVTAKLGQVSDTLRVQNYPSERTDATMLSVNVNFGIGVTNYYSGKAAAADHEAAKADLETNYRNSEFTIKNAFLKLAALEETYRENHKNLEKIIKDLDAVSKRIENQESVDLRSALETLHLTHEMWLAYSNAISDYFLARTQMAAGFGFYSARYL